MSGKMLLETNASGSIGVEVPPTEMTRISIITVVKNGCQYIEEAFSSLYSQTYPEVEHIVVDGGSTDGTLKILERYKDHISSLITERDNGMYEALNKGIRAATGDIIGLLHSDDMYADRDVLSDVAHVMETREIDACYGDLFYVDRLCPQKIRRYWKSGSAERDKFRWGWMPPHPTFFARKSIYETYGLFNTDIGSSSDYELMLRFLYKHGIAVSYIPRVLVHMRSGGISNESIIKRLRANALDRLAWEVNDLKLAPWTLVFKPLRKIFQYVNRSPHNDESAKCA